MKDSKTCTSDIEPITHSSNFLRVSEIVGTFVFGFAALLCCVALFGRNPLANIASVWAANLLMLGIVYLGLRCRGESWGHFGLCLRSVRWPALIRTLLMSIVVFVIAVAAFVAGAILMANIIGMPERADMSKYSYLSGNLTLTILALFSVYIVSTFAEEVIYRGFLITRIIEIGSNGKATRLLAVAISSILFGLVHSDWGLAGMVQASMMGLALGTAYLVVHRNLWVTILAHGYMDTLLILQMYFAGGSQ